MNLKDIIDQSHTLALDCIRYYKNIDDRNKEGVLSGNVMQSSISLAKFIHGLLDVPQHQENLEGLSAKLTNAYNRAREVKFWIGLSRDSRQMDRQTADRLAQKLEKLLSLLIAERKVLKNER